MPVFRPIRGAFGWRRTGRAWVDTRRRSHGCRRLRYDTTKGRASNVLSPSSANGHPPMVNWDIIRTYLKIPDCCRSAINEE